MIKDFVTEVWENLDVWVDLYRTINGIHIEFFKHLPEKQGEFTLIGCMIYGKWSKLSNYNIPLKLGYAFMKRLHYVYYFYYILLYYLVVRKKYFFISIISLY